ncbi:MAG: MgtC/SapB family protein [Candidatus Promineifilaceae bacterium]
MEHTELLLRFGIALLIGVLIGLEREYARLREEVKAFAGIRTFPLIALLGCSAALLTDLTGGWAFGVTLFSLGVLIAIAYAVDARQGRVGLTSEVASTMVFVCGALVYWDYLDLAAALAVVTFGFLTLKPQLHGLAQRVSSEDLYATLKFAAISLIILPVLPNQTYGPPPFDAFNPYKTWLMVVFISGISFLGYVLIKVIGPRRGIGLTGLLGGLASSTAVTLSFSERSQDHPDLARPFALAITLAWTVMFGRVIVEVAVLNQALLAVLWLPMAAGMAAGFVFCFYYYLLQRTHDESEVKVSNPFELGSAIKFGALYAIVLVVAKVAQYYFQDTGLYVASALAGLTDVDAITLSMAQLAGNEGQIALSTGARAVVLAVISNTVVKGGIAVTTGSRKLRQALLPPFLVMLITSAIVAFLLT